MHRLCDRPGSLSRLLEELVELGVSRSILVSAAPDARGRMRCRRRGSTAAAALGEYLQSAEAAAVRGRPASCASRRASRIFPIRPGHNPIGPFDFGGGFDDRSDRRQPLDELMARGYEDAYHQFIEPVVGASGEQLGLGMENYEVRSVRLESDSSVLMPNVRILASACVTRSCRNCADQLLQLELVWPRARGRRISRGTL